MSAVSKESLNENTTPLHGIFQDRDSYRFSAKPAARSSASGVLRNSHAAARPSAMVRSKGEIKIALHVTGVRPRMLSVPSALTWPRGLADNHTELLQQLDRKRLTPCGRIRAAAPILVEIGQDRAAFTVSVGKRSGAVARTAPTASARPRRPQSAGRLEKTPL